MDLRAYYKKVRSVEAQLEGDDIVLVSIATPEGGKDGVLTEAPRTVAAALIAEGRARLADKSEIGRFHDERRQARERADQEETARRMHVMVIPSPELRKTRDRS